MTSTVPKKAQRHNREDISAKGQMRAS